MRYLVSLLLIVLSAFNAMAHEPTVPGATKLWYDEPAEQWMEALPIGNGRLGAMIFGGTADERIQFNEDTLWAGGPRDYSHPGAAAHLDEIRQLLFDGKQREAEENSHGWVIAAALLLAT